MAGEVELRILGPLEVLDDAGHPLDIGGNRARAVLVDLALAPGRTIPAEQLLEDVWRGEQPAKNNLQVHIARLRRVLGDDSIRTRNGGYALDVAPGIVDAHRFGELASAGRVALRAGNAAEAAETLRRALSLWRGAPLVGFSDSEFARPVITRLDEARLVALEDRIDADLALGRHNELVGELEALVRAHPLRERLWAQLMTALYRAGRQADALRAYQRARAVLAEELGIEPGTELRELEHAVLEQDPSLAAPPPPDGRAHRAPETNLVPGATPLIGRTTEIGAIRALLEAHRVVTIVGPGGVGKTRLATEVGRVLLASHPDGVWLADLAPVNDETAVAAAIASALGVEAEPGPGAAPTMLERLRDYVSGREMLLLLDNCEHVVGEVARAVAGLIPHSGRLRVLTTSREPLAIAGEALWPLSPLALDDAIELFGARAHAVMPAFELADHFDDVRTICAKLDGLPLAIELAAARLRALAPRDLLVRPDDRFRLLTAGSRAAPPRQQTLRAVIDWSYALLDDEERRVFERASVFAGAFSLNAAEAVCSGPDVEPADVADVLARLVDKSLIVPYRDWTGAGFRLLQTLAQYGRERLAANGEVEAARARHAHYFAAAVDIPDAEHGSASRQWFGKVSVSIDDVRVAMEWALEIENSDVALALANGLGWFWHMGGRLDETWRWMTAALALPEPSHAAHKVRPLAWAGVLGIPRDKDRALAYGAEAVERARALGDDRALSIAAMLHGTMIADFFHHRIRSVPLLEECVRACEAVGDEWSLGLAALVRAAIRLVQGDYDGAPDDLRDCALRFGALGNPWGRSHALRELADLLAIRGEYDEAATALHDAIVELRAVGAIGLTSCLSARLGYIYELQGRRSDAERWLADAVDAAERQRYIPNLALIHNLRGIVRRRQDRLDDAEQCHREALALYSERGVPAGLALARASLGYVAELRGDVARAEDWHRDALAAACEAGDRRAQALALEGLAGVASLRGDDQAMGLLLGAADALRAATGGRLQPAESVDVDRAIARVHDHSAVDAAANAGRGDPRGVIARVLQRSPSVV